MDDEYEQVVRQRGYATGQQTKKAFEILKK